MRLYLYRMEFRDDGIFGSLATERGDQIAVTLEHAYQYGDGYAAKVPPRTYKCVREYSEKFEQDLFELKEVPGASEIKFHIGNYNDESDGCILLGMQIGNKNNGGLMITDSKTAFKRFMKHLDGVTEFDLVVE
jgi:hypothetical protein